MINTKSLSIRLGYSRFWRTKFIPTNFYENYHYFYINDFVERFFSQKVLNKIGFVYGHSVIKYFSSFVRVEVFLHDFRLEEFSKHFFKITNKSFRRRRTFRKKFFRPFFRKIFKFFKYFKKFKNYRKYNNNFKKNFSSKFQYNVTNKFIKNTKSNNIKNKAVFTKEKKKFNYGPNVNKFKRFFVKFKKTGNFVAKKNYRKSSRIKFKNVKLNAKSRKTLFFLKSLINFFKKYQNYIRFTNFIFKLKKFDNKKKVYKLKKIFFSIYKLFSIYKFIFIKFYKLKFIRIVNSNRVLSKFSNNFFLFYRKIRNYDRYFLFKYYSFVPFSPKFIKKYISIRITKEQILSYESHHYLAEGDSPFLFNFNMSNYYSCFTKVFKKLKKYIFIKFFIKRIKKKFSNLFCLFFSTINFSPFCSKSDVSENDFSNSFNVGSNPIFITKFSEFKIKKFIIRIKRIKKNLKKFFIRNVTRTRRVSIKFLNTRRRFRLPKSTNSFFFNFKKKKSKKIKRRFLPFFFKLRKISYVYFRFSRFKIYKFICNFLSRNFNTKFFGLPVKFFIRVLPAYRTTTNIFLRYFITKLFYRFMLGDVINPIVKTSIRRFRGFTLVSNGRFTRAQIASHRHIRRGSVSFSSISIPIDYNQICIPLKYGTCNLKLWIRF